MHSLLYPRLALGQSTEFVPRVIHSHTRARSRQTLNCFVKLVMMPTSVIKPVVVAVFTCETEKHPKTGGV